MGTFTVRELVGVAHSASMETFERLLGPLVLIGPPELNPHQRNRRRFRTQDGTDPTALSRLLDGVAHPIRKAADASGDQQEIVIGRDESVDVQVRHASVSKVHARIRLSPAGPQLEDAGSTNGTFYDNARVGEEQTVTLADGHHIRLGDVHLEVFEPTRLHRILASLRV